MIGVAYCPHCKGLFYGLIAERFEHPCPMLCPRDDITISLSESRRDRREEPRNPLDERVTLEVQWVRSVRQVMPPIAVRHHFIKGSAIVRLSARYLVEQNRRVRSVILSSGQFSDIRGDAEPGVVLLIHAPGGEVRVSESMYCPYGYAAVTFGDGSVEMVGPGWEVGP